jgi:protein-S-isoprenylcysteine O-methyltransferase Ste14
MQPSKRTSDLRDQVATFMVERSQKNYSFFQRAAAIAFGSTMELIVLPACFLIVGRWMDGWLKIVAPTTENMWLVIAFLCFVIGIPWLAASIAYQHWRGDGTPFPLVPTRQLVTEGPYRYTRNPMALGAIFWLLGWAFLSKSLCALVVGVGGFGSLVLGYDFFIEEKELSKRFGKAYDEYRKKTPFLFPFK